MPRPRCPTCRASPDGSPRDIQRDPRQAEGTFKFVERGAVLAVRQRGAFFVDIGDRDDMGREKPPDPPSKAPFVPPAATDPTLASPISAWNGTSRPRACNHIFSFLSRN